MNNNSQYKEIILAKNGSQIPVFNDGKTVDSKYNPDREADNIINNLDNFFSFFVVIGIGSGILIAKLLQRFPGCKVIGIEKNNSDISFLRKITVVQNIYNNSNVILSDIDHLEENLINNYVPALYGNLKIIEQRGWINENANIINIINEKLNYSIGIISADYSVQAHFGKIWQSNIINNLKNIKYANCNNIKNIDNSKTAVIVAAGPTLDNTINILHNKNNLFIIATDTAYPILIKNKIIPDAVISIDGQLISTKHFNKIINDKTIFFLDLCSNYNVGKVLIEHKCSIMYFISGHPLSSYADKFCNYKFLKLFSGAGTVTITAVDLSLKLGFKNIKIIGADFSYSQGKSYGKGSYFENIFGENEYKINTLERQYNNLMFRTELSKINNNKFTTPMLNAYKLSLEKYLKDNKCIFNFSNDIYEIYNKSDYKYDILSTPNFNYNNFINKIKSNKVEELKYPLLPYIAWLRNKVEFKNLPFNSLLKLAQSHIVSYN